jgi:hypothetical protein
VRGVRKATSAMVSFRRAVTSEAGATHHRMPPSSCSGFPNFD